MSGALACASLGPGERDHPVVQDTPPSNRVLIFICAVLSALLVAMGGGMLSYASGSSAAESVLYGGGAFILWMTLCVAVVSTFRLLE